VAYRPRPYGLGPYGDDLYSQYRQPDLAAPGGLVGRSSISRPAPLRDIYFLADLRGVSDIRARMLEDAVIHVGTLVGRSHASAVLRFYWEENVPCDTVWTVQPPPPFVCTELVNG
jgi:hypothetical protein